MCFTNSATFCVKNRKHIGKNEGLDADKKKDVTKGRKQIQESRGRLIKLEKDGLELVN